MENIETHKDLIAKLGTTPEVAAQLYVSQAVVRQWLFRNRIAPIHWMPIVELAKKQGIEVTYEWIRDKAA